MKALKLKETNKINWALPSQSVSHEELLSAIKKSEISSRMSITKYRELEKQLFKHTLHIECLLKWVAPTTKQNLSLSQTAQSTIWDSTNKSNLN